MLLLFLSLTFNLLKRWEAMRFTAKRLHEGVDVCTDVPPTDDFLRTNARFAWELPY